MPSGGFDEVDLCNLIRWCPDLPCLTSLTITDGTVMDLNFTGCPELHSLNIARNRYLLGLSGMQQTLCKLFLVDNITLLALNLSGCSKLQSLHCKIKYQNFSLNLTGWVALETLELEGNVRLTSLKLSDTISLEHLTVLQFDRLKFLDMTSCSRFMLFSWGNNSLTRLDLRHQLQELMCANHEGSRTLQLAGCAALQKLDS